MSMTNNPINTARTLPMFRLPGPVASRTPDLLVRLAIEAFRKSVPIMTPWADQCYLGGDTVWGTLGNKRWFNKTKMLRDPFLFPPVF